MYQSSLKQVKLNMKVSDLVIENPRLLLMLEHLELNLIWNDKTILKVCQESGIRPELFIAIANLYRGFNVIGIDSFKTEDITVIVKLLKNSHKYYKHEKYPEILEYLKQLNKSNNTRETEMLESFFIEYFDEVIEHLDYEENVAFPYICRLLNSQSSNSQIVDFSVDDYSQHHSDIESKLTDLKNLLLIHLQAKSNGNLKRKLLFSLFELENDLKVHSLIEENILVPLMLDLERDGNG